MKPFFKIRIRFIGQIVLFTVELKSSLFFYWSVMSICASFIITQPLNYSSKSMFPHPRADSPAAASVSSSSPWAGESGSAPVLRRLQQNREKRISRIKASESIIWEEKWVLRVFQSAFCTFEKLDVELSMTSTARCLLEWV